MIVPRFEWYLTLQVKEPAIYRIAQEPPVNVYCTGTCKDGSFASGKGAGQSVVDATNNAHTGIDVECVIHGGTDTYDSNCTLMSAPATSTWEHIVHSEVRCITYALQTTARHALNVTLKRVSSMSSFSISLALSFKQMTAHDHEVVTAPDIQVIAASAGGKFCQCRAHR